MIKHVQNNNRELNTPIKSDYILQLKKHIADNGQILSRHGVELLVQCEEDVQNSEMKQFHFPDNHVPLRSTVQKDL